MTDPAGGSHLVETLTAEMAEAAWALFQELEGGTHLDELIAATTSDRALQIAERKRPITGVSEFPNPAEELPERRPYTAAPDVHRYAGEFEDMRDQPATEPVFLATMGSVAQHTARASFARNLFAAGGIGVEAAGATSDVTSLVDRHAGQTVACLAGNDAAYAEWGADAAAALRENGVEHVIVAGKPRDWADDSCALGVDALAFLRQTREALA